MECVGKLKKFDDPQEQDRMSNKQVRVRVRSYSQCLIALGAEM